MGRELRLCRKAVIEARPTLPNTRLTFCAIFFHFFTVCIQYHVTYCQTRVSIDNNTGTMLMFPARLSWERLDLKQEVHRRFIFALAPRSTVARTVQYIEPAMKKTHVNNTHKHTETQYMCHVTLFESFPGADKVCSLP